MQRPFLQVPGLSGNLLLIAVLAGCSDANSAADPPRPKDKSADLVSDGTAIDWPRWRGANQDGVSLEAGWSATWPQGSPPIRWTADIGIGFGSMSVVDGRVFTMGHNPQSSTLTSVSAGGEQVAADALKRGIDTVWCLDSKSGDVLWSHTYPCLLVDNLHEGGPAATPTVYDGRVHSLSKEGHLVCLDVATGDVIWQRRLPDDLGVPMPEWGFSGSPLVEGDLVVVDGGRVAAYHRLTGEPVWQTEKFKPGYGTPVSFDDPSGGDPPLRLVAVLNNECLVVVRLSDGQEVARRKWTTQYDTSATTPVVVGDTIFVSTGYRRGCMLARLTGRRLETIYENREMCNHMNNSVLWNGHWYGFDGNSHRSRTATLTCLDYVTGEVKWAERGLGCGSLIVAGGKLVCLSDDGELAIVDASPQGYRELARAKILEGRCWTSPVLSGGHVYARNAEGTLVCVDLRTEGR
jgi:outer membrane protein assembly factor BamB